MGNLKMLKQTHSELKNKIDKLTEELSMERRRLIDNNAEEISERWYFIKNKLDESREEELKLRLEINVESNQLKRKKTIVESEKAEIRPVTLLPSLSSDSFDLEPGKEKVSCTTPTSLMSVKKNEMMPVEVATSSSELISSIESPVKSRSVSALTEAMLKSRSASTVTTPDTERSSPHADVPIRPDPNEIIGCTGDLFMRSVDSNTAATATAWEHLQKTKAQGFQSPPIVIRKSKTDSMPVQEDSCKELFNHPELFEQLEFSYGNESDASELEANAIAELTRWLQDSGTQEGTRSTRSFSKNQNISTCELESPPRESFESEEIEMYLKERFNQRASWAQNHDISFFKPASMSEEADFKSSSYDDEMMFSIDDITQEEHVM